MKRPFIILCLVLIVAAAVGGSDIALQRGLDRYLPPLLTEQLGLPVTIAPIRADVLTLTAYTDKLQMGTDGDPALVAEQVSVSLNWTDLLTGEIRLVTASGENLMVKISSWPSDDEPLPDDYYFLEQWLPRSIDLAAGRYVAADGAEWPIRDGRWRRTDGSASLAWREDRPAGSFQATVSLESLQDLLGLRRFRSVIELEVAGDELADSRLKLDIEPADDTSYTLAISGSLADMDGELHAQGAEPWSWPTSSRTRFKTLYPGRVVDLIRLFTADGVQNDFEQALESALPELDLPWHKGRIRMDEMRVGDEMVDDVRVEFLADGPRLAVTDIRMRGPSGDLRGSAAAVSTDSGWDAALGADIKARADEDGLLQRYLDADWYLETGRVRLKSGGGTWGELIDDMTGLLELNGSHRGTASTPISVTTTLDGEPRKFALENVEMKLGNSVISGEVRFQGGKERTLHFDARATDLDLKFLFDEQSDSREPGIAVPAYLVLFPGIDVFWKVDIEGLSLPALELASASLDIERKARQGHVRVAAKGPTNGGISIVLDYDAPPTGPVPVKLAIELDKVNVDRMLAEGGGGLAERTSGRLEFTSTGEDVQEIFESLRGTADLTVEFRPDRDWTRPSRPEEVLKTTGKSKLLLERDRIVGVEVDDLDIASIDQDISGNMSLSVSRDILFVANLESAQLDINRIMEWIPRSAEDADETNILQALRDLGSERIDLRVQEVSWLEAPVQNLHFRMESSRDRFDIDSFDFSYQGADVTNTAKLFWRGDVAEFNASGEVKSLGVEEFFGENLLDHAEYLQKSLEGNYTLAGRGSSIAEILAGLSGSVKLAGKPAAEGKPSPRIDIDLQRADSGLSATVNALALAGSDLRGKVVYSVDPRERLDISLDGGVLDLRPWEEQALAPVPAPQDGADDEDTERGAVGRTGQFIGDFLSSPARLMGAGGESTDAGDRLFSTDAIDLNAFQERDITVGGRLDEVHSKAFLAREITPAVTLEYGALQFTVDLGSINGGRGQASLSFDTGTSPPRLETRGLLSDIYGDPDQTTYPRSIHFMLDSSGASQAELAGNLNGMVYFEAGGGTIDYGGLALLTTDVATSMFRNLIPGARDRQPTLQCAITLGQFTAGKGITPYGYAARTRTANLLGGLEVDLKEEQLNLRFRSRSREGVGLSVGNAFSNTVDIAGPLNNPRIVPNAPSILFRGWAAFMTAGLSVIGESMINRALASSNPCDTIRDEIRKDLCSSDNPMAKSPLACPADGSKSWPQGTNGTGAAPPDAATADTAPPDAATADKQDAIQN